MQTSTRIDSRQERFAVKLATATTASTEVGWGPQPANQDVPRSTLMPWASEHGFKAGDIILDVGGKKVVSPVDVRNAIRDAQMNGKRAVLMRLKSDKETKFVGIPIARV